MPLAFHYALNVYDPNYHQKVYMVNETYNVRRYISEYSKTTNELLADYELETFNLKQFQAELDTGDDEPMFCCYPITVSKIDFIERCTKEKVKWDFVTKAYFLEAHSAESISEKE